MNLCSGLELINTIQTNNQLSLGKKMFAKVSFPTHKDTEF